MVGIRQEGESLPDGAVQRDEVRGQLHVVTGKVQSARAVICRAGSALNWEKLKKKKLKKKKQASLSGEQDSQVRGGRPPAWGTGYD